MRHGHLAFLLAAAGLIGNPPLLRPGDEPEETDEQRRRRLEHLDAVHREREETERRRTREHAEWMAALQARKAEWDRQRALPLDQPCERGGEHEIVRGYSTRTNTTMKRCSKCGGEEAMPARPLSRQQRRAMARVGKQ